LIFARPIPLSLSLGCALQCVDIAAYKDTPHSITPADYHY